MCVDYFLVNKQTQKHSPRFVLKNMCSENISEIQKSYYKGFIFFFFFFVKLQAKTMNVTENAFFICVLLEILLKYKKVKRNARTSGPTSLQNNSGGLFLKV